MDNENKLELLNALLLKKKQRGLNDLYFFNKYIIEDDEERRKLLVPHVHGEWATWYSNSTKRICEILVPRSCFKSSFFTIGESLRRIAENPSIRILIANATLGNAQNFLGQIKNHIQNNEVYKSLYGDMYDKNLKWNDTEMEVKGRHLGIREATVTAVGVGGNLVSQHYDMIIADDLINEQNSATRFQAEKVIDWWKRTFSLLEPSGKMLIVGTRWSYYELYAYLEDEYKDQVDFYIRGAKNPDGTFYFPERFNEEKLKELKKLHGSYIFSCFYENSPIDEDNCIIKESQILYWTDNDDEINEITKKIPSNLAMFSACDPAVSQESLADSSGFISVGVDSEGNWWIKQADREKITTGELIQRLFQQFETYNPITMSIEVIGQAQNILSPIRDEERARNKFLPLSEIKVLPQVTKAARIRSILQPRFENGKIYIHKDMTELKDQLLRFPKAKHDDLIDALSQIETIAFEARKIDNSPKIPYSSTLEYQLSHPNDRNLIDEFMGDDF
jgi:phage terminase large subunit-like protein